MAFCSECTFLDPEKKYESYDAKYWFETKDEWHYANEEACWRFCRAYGRSSNVSDSIYYASKDSQNSGSGCYITTIVCEILGHKDNCKELQTLRAFRDNVLQKDEKYHSLLTTYDIYGPKIAEQIRNDERKEKVALSLFNLGIKKVIECLDNQEYQKAISLYVEMTTLLITGYNIVLTSEDLNYSIPEDTSLMGHGRQYKLRSI